jgi:RNA polymerase sigma-70 factor (ECF subfamily)
MARRTGAARTPALGDALAAARRGDADAFEVLYRAFAGRVAGYLRVQGAREPEDLTSEVFLAAFRNITTFVGTEPEFRSWLFVIAHRRLLDERRRSARRPDEPIAALDDDPRSAPLLPRGDVEADALRVLGAQRVQAVCESLVPDQRDVLLLRLVADLTVDQVASVLGKSSGAVKQLQRRALAAIERRAERAGVPL